MREQPLKLDSAALLIIDLQQGFEREYWEHWAGNGGMRNHPDAERVAGDLLQEWRDKARPVVHVCHDSTSPVSPLHPSKPGNAFSRYVRPQEGEQVYRKNVNSAFIGTTLEADLQARGIDTLVAVGIQTDHCVSTTVRMAGNLGFRTYVVDEATATFDRAGPNGRRFDAELMHATALASLHGEFAQVIPVSALLGNDQTGRLNWGLHLQV